MQMLGASRLNTKTLLWFYMVLGCSPRVEIVDVLITTFSRLYSLS